eukprot:Partr_v1_DN23007_c0_g1_i1_m27176 putative Prostaglandin E synthase 3
MVSQEILTPTVSWAQRCDVIYLTLELADVKNEQVHLSPTQLEFSGTCGQGEGSKEYALKLEFFKPVVPEESKQLKTGQNFTFVIKKDVVESYWPRLLKEEGKQRWLKTDFAKWRDEDEESEEESPAADPMMMQGGGNPFGAGGAGGMDFGGLDMANLAKMMPPGMMGGMAGGMGADSDDEDLQEQEKEKDEQVSNAADTQ